MLAWSLQIPGFLKNDVPTHWRPTIKYPPEGVLDLRFEVNSVRLGHLTLGVGDCLSEVKSATWRLPDGASLVFAQTTTTTTSAQPLPEQSCHPTIAINIHEHAVHITYTR